MSIEAVDVTVEKSGRTIVRGASFSVPTGSVTGLIGPNGAGKSTLLDALSGECEPQKGTVRLQGNDPFAVSLKELARLRAVMLQDVAVAFSFLVRDVVEMGRNPWSGTDQSAYDEAIINRAMELAQVGYLQDRDVTTLSGGERARTAFARVLAQRTKVLFLDEPTAAMDIAHQEHTMSVVRSLAREGVTVMVVLHDLQAAAAYCDHIVCLNKGEVAAAGVTGEVLTAELLSEVYQWPVLVAHEEDGLTVSPRRGHFVLEGELFPMESYPLLDHSK